LAESVVEGLEWIEETCAIRTLYAEPEDLRVVGEEGSVLKDRKIIC
jgi:hypothetical protein